MGVTGWLVRSGRIPDACKKAFTCYACALFSGLELVLFIESLVGKSNIGVVSSMAVWWAATTWAYYRKFKFEVERELDMLAHRYRWHRP